MLQAGFGRVTTKYENVSGWNNEKAHAFDDGWSLNKKIRSISDKKWHYRNVYDQCKKIIRDDGSNIGQIQQGNPSEQQ